MEIMQIENAISGLIQVWLMVLPVLFLVLNIGLMFYLAALGFTDASVDDAKERGRRIIRRIMIWSAIVNVPVGILLGLSGSC